MIKIQRPVCPDAVAIKTNYKHPVNKTALQNASHEKCMYCESKVSHVYFGDVEHIKPKSKFPNLEFEWTNHGFVCSKCNNTKSDKWDDGVPFINPYDENPDSFIVALGAFVYHKGGSERGEFTWKEIGLNRPELVERRKERIDSLLAIVDKATRTNNPALKKLIVEEIKNELLEDRPYSMTSRATIKTILPNGTP